MDMTGETLIPAPREAVWRALNDPEILRQSIPGCETIEKTSDTSFAAKVVAKVGPVRATFTGQVELTDLDPPNGYRISGEGKGGPAGFAKGGAQVRLSTVAGDKTRLAYDVKASVGGKLAQIGSRLVDAAAKKVADDFFRNFNAMVGAPEGDGESTVILPKMDDEATVVLKPPPKEAAAAHEDEHHDDDHPEPIPRDPSLPDVSPTTLMFFAAGSLVVFVVALVVLMH